MIGLNIVASSTACVQQLRCDEVWDAAASAPLRPTTPKQSGHQYGSVCLFGNHRTQGDKTELKKLYYNIIDSEIREMDHRFSELNSELARVVVALNPESDIFLDVKAVMQIRNLS